MRLVFTDLDDTLFATARHHSSLDGCTVASSTREGEPSGYQSLAHQHLWEWLQQFGQIVPVTARTHNALKRVHLPFSPHRVWNFGLSVQLNGHLDGLWHEKMLSILTPINAQMAHLWPPMVENIAAAEYTVSPDEFGGLISQWGLRAHSMEEAATLKAVLSDFIARFQLPLWVHNQSDKWLYLTPVGVGKEHAVRYLLEQLRPASCVGVGDNPSDIAFMRLCDFSLFPSGCLALRPFQQQPDIEGL